jgi:hypothetical protein
MDKRYRHQTSDKRVIEPLTERQVEEVAAWLELDATPAYLGVRNALLFRFLCRTPIGYTELFELRNLDVFDGTDPRTTLQVRRRQPGIWNPITGTKQIVDPIDLSYDIQCCLKKWQGFMTEYYGRFDPSWYLIIGRKSNPMIKDEQLSRQALWYILRHAGLAVVGHHIAKVTCAITYLDYAISAGAGIDHIEQHMRSTSAAATVKFLLRQNLLLTREKRETQILVQQLGCTVYGPGWKPNGIIIQRNADSNISSHHSDPGSVA